MAFALQDSAEDQNPAARSGGRRTPEASFRRGGREGRLVIRQSLRAAEEKLAAAQAAAEASPADPKAAVALARLHYGLGQVTRAVETLDACASAGDQPKSFYQDCGQLFLSIGLYRRAERWLKKAISVTHNPSPALLGARAWALEGAAADAAQGVTPEGKRQFLAAVERLVRGRAEAAAEILKELTAAHPAFAGGWLARRGALEAAGHNEEAKALGAEWLAAAPGSEPGIKAAMSFALSRRGLTFDPAEPLVLRRMGEALEEFATREALHAGGDRILYLERGGAETVLEPVIPLEACGPQQTRFPYRVADRYVVALEGGAVLGRGIVLNSKGEMPAEVWPPCHMGKAGFARVIEGFVCDPAAYHNGVYPVQVFDTPALLMAAPTDNSFGDWVVNLPPRLVLAEAAGVDCPLVLSAGVPKSFVEMLGTLGWGASRIVYHNPRGLSIFPRLYTTSWPLLDRDEPMSDIFGVYRRSPGRRTGGGERIYLSREGVSGRKLENEAEIRSLFESRGFRAVRPETLSLQQAKDLIANADLIGGPYGSAFLNVVHAPKPPSALVIVPPTSMSFLSEVALWVGGCGGRIAYLFGDGEPDGGVWTASPRKVEAALDEFLAKTAAA